MAYPDTYDEVIGTAEAPHEEEEERARAEARWYADIRRALVVARRRAGLDQTALAEAIGGYQSEVSRVENGLSDRTRLGTVRSHVEGCGGTLAIVVLDKDGRVVLDQLADCRAWLEPARDVASDPATEEHGPAGPEAGAIDAARLETALEPVIARARVPSPARGRLIDEILGVVRHMVR